MSISYKRTKILATIGPATNSYDKIKSLIEAGANGFRLNFSHGEYSERDQQIAWIRQASSEIGRPVAILQDLQGPKIRLGALVDNSYMVKSGDEIVLDNAVTEHDGSNILPVQYNLAEKVKPGEPIYIFDGKIRTTVLSIESETAVRLRVENSGELMSKKGINLPDTDFGGDILTPKDLRDVEYGLDKDIDFVALSFVQSPDDITNLRQILVSGGSEAQIIAKIETKVAIQDKVLEEIVKVSDGIMVARGDLAVEAGAEIVPVVQRQLLALCRKHGKLAIVATQMMASMVDAPEPTRAEISDVANAVIQGADAVMLSDETANGSYPVEAVAAMRKTIVYTQEHVPVIETNGHAVSDSPIRDAISASAVKLAEQLGVDAIVAETKSGATAVNIAKYRPSLPIISVTSSARVAQQLALNYGNRGFIRPDGDKAGTELARELKSQGFFQKISPDDGSDSTADGTDYTVTVIIVSGRQPGVTGGTDTVRVRVL